MKSSRSLLWWWLLLGHVETKVKNHSHRHHHLCLQILLQIFQMFSQMEPSWTCWFGSNIEPWLELALLAFRFTLFLINLVASRFQMIWIVYVQNDIAGYVWVARSGADLNLKRAKYSGQFKCWWHDCCSDSFFAAEISNKTKQNRKPVKLWSTSPKTLHNKVHGSSTWIESMWMQEEPHWCSYISSWNSTAMTNTKLTH